MKRLLLLVFFPSLVLAHHGVAGLGTSTLEGPGAGLETSSSFTLPRGHFLILLKNEYVKFRKYKNFQDQKESYNFTHLIVAYGLKPWLTLMVSQPYGVKEAEFGTSRGLMDTHLHVIFGFKYDEGLKLIPQKENLEDLRDWHFALNLGVSLPTGSTEKKYNGNLFSPDMQPGFGKPTYLLSFSASKWLTDRYTLNLETSYQKFRKHTYEDGIVFKFGDEFRFNAANVYTLYRSENKRIDGIAEFNFLYLQRDKENGQKVEGSGGKILYLQPGFRFYYKGINLFGGIKLPVWKDLNEEDQQQGSEGKERYRLLLGVGYTF